MCSADFPLGRESLCVPNGVRRCCTQVCVFLWAGRYLPRPELACIDSRVMLKSRHTLTNYTFLVSSHISHSMHRPNAGNMGYSASIMSAGGSIGANLGSPSPFRPSQVQHSFVSKHRYHGMALVRISRAIRNHVS
ncbi:uncharacterized protein HMPREF1120_02911 [Exophiala dermatitidis NIH/UT8656]|uniref:Uncharacterized protein n=1 Tax=Exophiala dermatitidis (strain ATCC 34100 / CBS 525.76 / NIH/UT8656) TaxID=858893 RepID=H6BRL7_EXODN|nr:uncharacterized protein HMPREF1120_02911 [Exophiala dermatitidis NIH/UT8656]EHY54746.1 hypothetical protein HMPREF1120_02911 [Exophiala dermatitidis NIH/UT8656]